MHILFCWKIYQFKGFLEGLDLLHYFIDHVVYQTKLKGPTFRCEQSGDSLLLHYYSTRTNLYPIVKGFFFCIKKIKFFIIF